MKSSYKLAISEVELQMARHEKKNLVWVFFMQKYYDKIQSVLLDNFIKRILLISEELSSGVYVRGFFMWH